MVHVILILWPDYQKPLLLVILHRLNWAAVSQADCLYTICSMFMIRVFLM